MKRLKDVETDRYVLEVYECDCGFHIGLDASYLDQVGDIIIPCPGCGKDLDTELLCQLPLEDDKNEK